MSALLAIEVSPRENSVSRRLTERFIDHWKAAHPGAAILRRNLAKTPLPFIDESWLRGEPPHASDELIAELQSADHLVIGTPMYNFQIPASLKAYIDQIVRIGITVTPQYEGLLKGKRATVILASGGSYETTAASTYLQQILGFLGIEEVAVVLAGHTLEIDRGQTTLAAFTAQFERRLYDAAH